MFIKNLLAPLAAYILRNISTHRNRKRFAKLVGPYFDGVIAKTAYGFPMIARWQDNMNRISFEGSYGIVAEFIKDLPRDVLFIDIGANQGCTSILASRVFNKSKNSKGAIMAFEPSPSIFNLLTENILLNKCDNIYTFKKAISSEEAELFLDETNPGNSGGSHISNKGSSVVASPINLDDVKLIGNYKDVYIKIDTEGYEISVLNGLNELFDANLIRKIIIEVDDNHLKKYGNRSSEIYSFLDNKGYKPLIGFQKGHYDEVFIEK